MKLQEFGLKQVINPLTIALSLFGIRVVKMVGRYGGSEIIILGVPPWRALSSNDLYTKRCYEIK